MCYCPSDCSSGVGILWTIKVFLFFFLLESLRSLWGLLRPSLPSGHFIVIKVSWSPCSSLFTWHDCTAWTVLYYTFTVCGWPFKESDGLTHTVPHLARCRTMNGLLMGQISFDLHTAVVVTSKHQLSTLRSVYLLWCGPIGNKGIKVFYIHFIRKVNFPIRL